MREVTGGLMATRAWIRLGAVWVLWIVVRRRTCDNAFYCLLFLSNECVNYGKGAQIGLLMTSVVAIKLQESCQIEMMI